MGQSLLGGSSSRSSSSNVNNGLLTSTYQPAAQQGVGAQNFIAQLLGLQGGDEANQGFQNYLNSSNYKFQLGEGMKALTSNNATKGLLNSGAALKGAQSFGQNLASTGFNNFLSQLGNVAQLGQGAGGIIANAGQQSTSKGSSSNGLVSLFSDRRLKTDIQLVSEVDGLKFYKFRYKDSAREELGVDGAEYGGVLAQDLIGTKYAPAIVEDDASGYFKVDYDMLDEIAEAA